MHTHTTASVYTPWRRASRTAGEEAHFPSPFTSSRVVGVLVGYSPEFTVKRKQWPRQNRSLGTNARKIGVETRNKWTRHAIDRDRADRPRLIALIVTAIFRLIDRWLIDNERTKFNQDSTEPSSCFASLYDRIEKVFERNRDRRVEKNRGIVNRWMMN